MAQVEKIPKVSVCVITYNQEKYIRQCLQSIVDQELDCEFEIVVGDDCSSDTTRKLIQEFQDKYPRIFRIVFQENNTGGTKNMYDIYEAARGIYIAHIDGDDVMLPGKLQHQVKFLDEHPECSMVVHDVQVIDDASRIIKENWVEKQVPASADLSYLVEAGCFFPHSSKMFRKSAVRSSYAGKPVVDFYLHIEHAQSGMVGYMDEVLGQYRKTNSGITSPNSGYRIAVMSSYLDAYELAMAAGVHQDIVRRARMSFRYVNAMASLRAGDIAGFKLMSAYDKKDSDLLGVRERFIYWMARWPIILQRIVNSFDLIAKQLNRMRGRK